MQIYSPPGAMIDWSQWSSDVKLHGRITRPKHIAEMFYFGSRSTVMAIWNGEPVGIIPYLRVCKMLKMDPLKYYVER